MYEHFLRSKKIDDLSFDDLYIEENNELYPNIKYALGRLRSKFKNRNKPSDHRKKQVEKKLVLPMQALHTNHLRHTRI